MSRWLVGIGLLLSAWVASADQYQVTFGWTDPTAYIPSDAPVYHARYRVAGGAEVELPALSVPGGSTTVEANPGDAIDVAARACNLGLCSDWTGWVTATAPHAATQPANQHSLTITVTRQ